MAFLILLVIIAYSLNEMIILIPRKSTHVTHRGDFFTYSRNQPVKPDVSWGKKKKKTKKHCSWLPLLFHGYQSNSMVNNFI